MYTASSAEPHLQSVQRENTDKPAKVSVGGNMQFIGQHWDWKKMINRERSRVTPDDGENKADREMDIICANDESLYQALKGGTALGMARQSYFRSCFCGLTCSPSVEGYRGYVRTCCLPAC